MLEMLVFDMTKALIDVLVLHLLKTCDFSCVINAGRTTEGKSSVVYTSLFLENV